MERDGYGCRGQGNGIGAEVAELPARAGRGRGVQDSVCDNLRHQQARELGLGAVHAPGLEGVQGDPPRLRNHDRLGREDPLAGVQLIGKRAHHQDRHVVIDVAGNGLLRGPGDRVGIAKRRRTDRPAQHAERLFLRVVAGAVGPGPAVGQAVGVKNEGGPRREDERLLLVRRQTADARAAHAEQDALVADLHLLRRAVHHEQRRVVPRVGKRQLARPGIVDEVRAAHGGRAGGQRIRADGSQGAAPLIQLAQDVGRFLLVLGESAQRGPELAHHGGGAGPAALDVTDDDAHPPRGQRDDVVPVTADLCLDALAVRLQRLGRHIPAGHLDPVQLGQLVRQQALLEHQGGLPLRLEQHRVVDGDRDPARDRAEQVAVIRAVPPSAPVREPGQGQAHDAQQLAPGVQRKRDHRAHRDVETRPQAVRAGCRIGAFVQVRDDEDFRPRHGLLAEMTFGVMDLLPDGGPRSGRRLPAAGVGLDPPDQLVALEQVDEAMIGELRDEHVGDVAQSRAKFERAAEALPDALQQPDPVPLGERAPARLPGEDGDTVDGAGGMAQRHAIRADQQAGTVFAGAGEGSLPGPPVQDGARQLRELVLVPGREADAEDGLPEEPGRMPGHAQQLARVFVDVQQAAVPVGDDDGHLRLVEQHLRGQERLARGVHPGSHACAP